MPARPPAQAAAPLERGPAPGRDLPLDHTLGKELHHRTHPVPHLIPKDQHAGWRHGGRDSAGRCHRDKVRGPVRGTVIAGQGGARYHKRDFWADENLKYAEPHFRMRKVAREVRRIARGRECDLLDVGCGPATLARLMPPGVRYHGVDISPGISAGN